MALRKCPECNNDRFEIIEGNPSDNVHDFSIVQCVACGTVIGFMSANRLMESNFEKGSQDEFQEAVNSKLHVLNSNLRRLNRFMQQLDKRISHLEKVQK